MYTKIASLAALWATTLPGLVGQRPAGPEEALRALQAGNRRFVQDESKPQPIDGGRRRTLSTGQAPYAIIVSCADSRVPPEHVFNAGLGDLFVIRTAGNVCDPETLASIEYAVQQLGTPLCVVMGHEQCGAVAAAAEGLTESSALDTLLNRISPSVRKLREQGLEGRDLLDRAEEENAQHSIHEALSRNALLRAAVRSGRFRILPARYRLATGEVEWLPERSLPPETPGNEPRPDRRAQLVRGLPPHVAMSMLRAGHRRFLTDHGQRADLSETRREDLLLGQRPIAVVITCSDSRVSPELLFDLGLGELFVIRVAGNVINEEVLASVEYAVEHTGASLVLALGHSGCGAVIAAAAADEHDSSKELSPSMRSLLGRIEPAIRRAREEGLEGSALIDRSVAIHARRVADLLAERSMILKRDLDQGLIEILAAVYDLRSGDLHWLDSEDRLAAAAKPETKPQPAEAHPWPAPLAETGPELHEARARPTDSDPAHPEGSGGLLQILFAAVMISTGGVLFLVLRRRDRIEIESED